MKQINLKDLGAVPNNPSFDNTVIIQNAFDTYKEIVIDDIYYATGLVISKPIYIRSVFGKIVANKVSDYVLDVRQVVKIEGKLEISGSLKAKVGLKGTRLGGSDIEDIFTHSCLLYGIDFSSGNNHGARFGRVHSSSNGKKVKDISFTKETSPLQRLLLNGLTESQKTDFKHNDSVIIGVYLESEKYTVFQRFHYRDINGEQYLITESGIPMKNTIPVSGKLFLLVGAGIYMNGGLDSGNVTFNYIGLQLNPVGYYVRNAFSPSIDHMIVEWNDIGVCVEGDTTHIQKLHQEVNEADIFMPNVGKLFVETYITNFPDNPQRIQTYLPGSFKCTQLDTAPHFKNNFGWGFNPDSSKPLSVTTVFHWNGTSKYTLGTGELKPNSYWFDLGRTFVTYVLPVERSINVPGKIKIDIASNVDSRYRFENEQREIEIPVTSRAVKITFLVRPVFGSNNIYVELLVENYTLDDNKLLLNNSITKGSSTPTTVPLFVGQVYYDTKNKKKYEAFGTTSSDDWILMN